MYLGDHAGGDKARLDAEKVSRRKIVVGADADREYIACSYGRLQRFHPVKRLVVKRCHCAVICEGILTDEPHGFRLQLRL